VRARRIRRVGAAGGRRARRAGAVRGARIAAEFVETWRLFDDERNTLHKQILERDDGLCQVPGCSRAADHAHHIVFRSAGGTDDHWNLVSLCAAHHLHCVHMGWIRVTGRAPDGLRWELGLGARA